jgi:hypothetical protein
MLVLLTHSSYANIGRKTYHAKVDILKLFVTSSNRFSLMVTMEHANYTEQEQLINWLRNLHQKCHSPHERPPLDYILSYLNPIHTLTPYSCNNSSNISPPSTSRTPDSSLFFWFSSSQYMLQAPPVIFSRVRGTVWPIPGSGSNDRIYWRFY